MLLTMPILQEPSITLEGVKIRSVSLSTLSLDVSIRVQNQNPLGITLKEIPFVVMSGDGTDRQEIAKGNTGTISIPARGSTLIPVPVVSHNKALIRALATLVTGGGVPLTIRGTAVIDCVVTHWSVPFEKTVTVTARQIAGAMAGKKDGGK
jgi:LEA14-like dessication related protein